MSKSKKTQSNRRSQKRVRFGVPRKRNRIADSETKRSFFPTEDWHEPVEGEKTGYKIIEKDPGPGLRHAVSASEISFRLSKLPGWMLQELDVVQLGQITRKKKSFPCYGMQWGTTLYLYPIDNSLVEEYSAPPSPQLLMETRMHGGTWEQDASEKTWRLVWTEKTLRDFYLNNILIHELGHLLDDRNTGYHDREKYAEWFAIEYGYKPSRSKKQLQQRQSNSTRRHHR